MKAAHFFTNNTKYTQTRSTQRTGHANKNRGIKKRATKKELSLFPPGPLTEHTSVRSLFKYFLEINSNLKLNI